MPFVGSVSLSGHDLCPLQWGWRPRMTYGPCPDTGALPIVVSDTQHSEYEPTTADSLPADAGKRPRACSTTKPKTRCEWGDPGAAGAHRTRSTTAQA
ncbi:protein of unknown function [Azospirillum lipoferum 4B]|uniref:Uncharacterized protein n=1 Tax=Azospirillum lipoferum (strain 4B) TaxID=862719 RepID=G7Z516_AZOL4|nr:protein of unknown function [Azospirillum lipoferum 4B]